MSSPGDAPGRAGAWAASVQARGAQQAAVEAVRLQESLQLAVSALSAIGDRARRLSRYSARVRVLEPGRHIGKTGHTSG